MEWAIFEKRKWQETYSFLKREAVKHKSQI